MDDSNDNSAAARTRRLPARYSGIIGALLLSLLMTCIVSFISTLRGIGLAPDLIRVWLGSWALSWAIAFPTLLVVLPVVRRATSLLVDES